MPSAPGLGLRPHPHAELGGLAARPPRARRGKRAAGRALNRIPRLCCTYVTLRWPQTRRGLQLRVLSDSTASRLARAARAFCSREQGHSKGEAVVRLWGGTIVAARAGMAGFRGQGWASPLGRFVTTGAARVADGGTLPPPHCLPRGEARGRGGRGGRRGRGSGRRALGLLPRCAGGSLRGRQRLSGADSFRQRGLGSGSYNNTAGAPSFPHMLNSFPSELLGKQGAPPSAVLRGCTLAPRPACMWSIF